MNPGTRLGPYEILAPLGAGGMGEVYRARDTRLGREVAVKVLPAEFAQDVERLRRFEQEARATAALDHPNILAVFDIGTHEGTPYIVEQLLEGESLRDRLRGGPLTPAKAVEFGIQIAQGLAAAHEKGIVHRDLKPGNLFITKEGRIKILDFGLARLSQPECGGAEALSQASTAGQPTREGKVLGTPGYMAPEQVRGYQADARSDIFAFGCILYEMLSGKRAFEGATHTDIAAAILKDDPPDLLKIAPRVPPGLAQLVQRCIEKRPQDRFSSAHDLALALESASGSAAARLPGQDEAARHSRWWVWASVVIAATILMAVVGVAFLKHRSAKSGTTPPATQKIIVLPFENLGAPEDAYFASGMTEEITSRLANVRGLAVISRTTAMQYEGRHETVKQIGAELGVDYVLEGSVRWEHGLGRASRVRITPQLIRVADDTHVWADRFDRDLADVFSIQSDVAESTVRAMGVALLPQEQIILKEASTRDQQAYDLYLRGLEAERGGVGRQNVESALRMYQAAVDRDPRFAQALAGFSRMLLMMHWFSYDRSPEQVCKAREAAEQAVHLQPGLAETHIALGFYYYWGLLDYPKALEAFATALKIQPDSSTARAGIGYVVNRQGHWTRSVEELGRALELDPKNVVLLQSFAESCVRARRYSDADRALRRAIDLNPREADPRADEAWLEVQWHGDAAKAQAILVEAGQISGLPDDEGRLLGVAVRVALSLRDVNRAFQLLEAPSRAAYADKNRHWDILLLLAEVQAVAGRRSAARMSFEAASQELERSIQQNPKEGLYHSALGIAYAGLGMGVDAIREARLGCSLTPPSKDAQRALDRLRDLARVYAMTGHSDKAIATLDDLLSRSGVMTPHVLRLEPGWDPLRSNPHFQVLLQKYEVKG